MKCASSFASRLGLRSPSFYTFVVHADVTGKVNAGGREWPFLHALGRPALPPRVRIGGREFAIERFVKHDFFAATGFYTDTATGQRVVVKIARTESLLGVPMRWLGYLICRRELGFYRRLADLPCVPTVIGPIGKTGFAHTYVAGRPLERGVAVPDGFFDELLATINTLAARGMAVVDTQKPENILLGDDGRPHLIDFQISYDTRWLVGLWPARVLLRVFVNADRYHVLKHKLRLRPDLMTDADRRVVQNRTWPVRLHRTLTRPYFVLRRRLFAHLRAAGRLMPEGSK